MKNLQFCFAFLLALIASSFTLPNAQPTNLPKNNSLPAAVDYYLKIEGIPGESKDADHKGWIEIQSVSWNTPDKTVNISRMTSPISSPIIMQFCTQREHFAEAIIHQRTPDGTYRTIKLKDGIITNYQASASSARPMESLSLNYTKIIW